MKAIGGALAVLTLVFIVLKVTNVISWSWYLVLLPFWVPIALILGILFLWVMVAGIIAFVEHFARK